MRLFFWKQSVFSNEDNVSNKTIELIGMCTRGICTVGENIDIFIARGVFYVFTFTFKDIEWNAKIQMKAKQSLPYILEVGCAEGCVVKYLIELSGCFKTSTADLLTKLQYTEGLSGIIISGVQKLQCPEVFLLTCPQCNKPIMMQL